jgi:hypothetical protein
MAGHLILRQRAAPLRTSNSVTYPNPRSALSAVVDALSHVDVNHGIVKRGPTPSTTDSAFPTKSCGPNDNSGICQKPVSASNNTTLPIVLGVVIPLTVAMVIFIVLHRRHVKKLRSEDANDRHKSLDFGMGDVIASGKKSKNAKKGKPLPEMSLADTEKTLGRRGRGLSMDMDMSNPYLLPPELQQSRESLHSLSRNMNNGDDKYRPATTFIPNDESGSRVGSSSHGADDSSSYSASTRRVFGEKENESNQSLLRHAQRISRSMPPTRSPTPGSQDPEHAQHLPRKLASPIPRNDSLAPASTEGTRESYRSDVSKDVHTAGIRKSNDYLGAFIRSGGPAAVETKSKEKTLPTTPSIAKEELALKKESVVKGRQVDVRPLPEVKVDSAPLDFDFAPCNDPAPAVRDDKPEAATMTSQTSIQAQPEEIAQEYEEDFSYDPRRLTMGFRPLPPDDPTEDPEQRAIRIRSFYKEYFDETKPGQGHTQQNYQQGPANFYYEDSNFDESYGQYDSGGAPFAQPLGRRAMTPPPRGPSRSQNPGRMAPSRSGGHFVSGGPRAFSSASGQFRSRSSSRGPPKKKFAPPLPLQILPTPHLLKDDSIIPMDFAPPSSFRERRAGTPTSLKGGVRPYSPALPAHLPLASSFDDLAVMPSP